MREQHGMTNTDLYRRWKAVRQRCLNPKQKRYSDYGGRGIKLCERWDSFINFRDDMLPGYKKELSLERIDNDNGYSPENCVWANLTQQHNNTRKVSNALGYSIASDGRFNASIKINGKTKGLGIFNTELEARNAYITARQKKFSNLNINLSL